MINYIEKQLPFHNRKRLEFIYSVITTNIDKSKKYRILDVGCGTGELFTIPLATRLQEFKNVEILGIDIHPQSIERAKGHIDKLGLKNLNFDCKAINEIEDHFDCVCLMAVLEHLTNPETMLTEIRGKVRHNGLSILYIPNGRGAYEIESAIFRKLKKSGLLSLVKTLLKPTYQVAKSLKHGIYYNKNTDTNKNGFIIKETLNDPNNIHIQFFKLKGIKRILCENGFLIKDVFKTRFIGGPLSNIFIHRFKILEDINYKVASKVPNIVASDWTFICTTTESHNFGSEEYFNRLYAGSKEPWSISFRASQRYRYNAYLQTLKQFSANYTSVLDIGCSQGQFTAMLQDIASNIIAVDISEIAIQRAKEKYGNCKKIRFEVGSLPLLKYNNEQFDLVLALEVLYYLEKEERIKALKEIKKVMQKDGFLLTSVNMGKAPYFKIDEFYNLINDFFQIRRVEYSYTRIYSFFERKLLRLERTKLQKTIRYLLSIERLVNIGQRLTKLIFGRKGITIMYIMAQKSES